MPRALRSVTLSEDGSLSAREAVRFWLVTGVVVLAPLPFGSVALLPVLLWTSLLSLGILIAPPRPTTTAAQGLLWGIVLLSGTFASAVAIQFIPDAGVLPAHPIWAEVRAAGHEVADRFAVRARIPDQVLAGTVLCLVSVLAGFSVGLKRQHAYLLYQSMARAGVLYATFALVSHVVDPRSLLWREKAAYVADVTGTFVNRNSAAAYFGLCSVIWAGILARRLASIELLWFGRWPVLSLPREAHVPALASAAAFVICLTTLLGTHSRGGTITAAAALGIGAIIYFGGNPFRRGARGLLAPLTLALVILGALTLAVSRVHHKGLFDPLRWATYESSLLLIGEQPLLGTGLGSFPDVFPSVRSDAAPITGAWDKAHSTVLELAIELGVPLTALLVLAVAGLFEFLSRDARRSRGTRKLWVTVSACILPLGLLHSLVDFPLQIPGVLIPFAVLASCGLAIAVTEPEGQSSASIES